MYRGVPEEERPIRSCRLNVSDFSGTITGEIRAAMPKSMRSGTFPDACFMNTIFCGFTSR